jgi:predicted O-linked N-acetylglucosamine transferase (SPINDLY family)
MDSQDVKVSLADAFSLATDHHTNGRLDQALAVYDAILDSRPDHLQALFYAAQAANAARQSERAHGYLARAFALAADNGQICRAFGDSASALGRWAEAEAAYGRLAQLTPLDADIWFLRSVAMGHLGRPADEDEALSRCLSLNPDHLNALCQAGIHLLNKGRPVEALPLFARLTELAPHLWQGWSNLSATLITLNRFEEALAPARRTMELTDNKAGSARNLGIVLDKLGRPDEALAVYAEMVRLAPQDAANHQALGKQLEQMRRKDEAIACYRRAVALDPHNAVALHSLGMLLPHAEGFDYVKRATEIDPRYLDAVNNLGILYGKLGDAQSSLDCYRRALTIAPGHAAIHSNLLLHLCYMDTTQEQMLAEHQAWAAIHEAPHRAEIKTRLWANARDPDRPLRIAYLSGDFGDHPASFFLEPLIHFHDRSRVHVTCYCELGAPGDAVTKHFVTLADSWVHSCNLSDDQFFRKIQDDRIDLLIDCSGHTAHNRMPVVARKPAPVQAHWMGYAATTGLSSMDYVILDPYTVPPDQERFYTEAIWRLPRVMRPFHWLKLPPDVAPLPWRTRGRPAFGSVNSFVKVTDSVLEVWAELLRRVPDAVMVVGGHKSRAHVAEAFARHGIASDRLDFIDRLPLHDFQAEISRRVDVALDPFPHSGGTTTFHSLMMGIPLVAMAGDRATSRGSMAILTPMGLGDLVAWTPEQYLDIATRLVADPDALERMRGGLRERLIASPFMDFPGFARDMEDAYRAMWRRWLHKTLPASA